MSADGDDTPAPDITEPAAERHSVARNTSVLLISQAATSLAALVTTALVPRYLGPDGIGHLRIGGAVWNMATVFITFGLGNAVIVRVARDRTDTDIIGRSAGAQFLMCIPAYLAVAGLMLAAGFDGTTVAVVAIGGLGVLTGCVVGPVRAGFYGIEQMTKPALVDVVARAATTVLKIALLLAGFGVVALAASELATSVIALVVLVPAAATLFGTRAIAPRVSRPRRLLAEGWPYFANEVTLVVYLQIDTIVIALVATNEEIGWYAVADLVFGTLLFAPSILMSSMFPVFARLDVEGRDALDQQVRRAFDLLMLIAIPIGLGTLAIATPFSVLLFGEEFRQTGPVLAIYGLVVLLSFPTILLGRVALATDRQMLWTKLMIVAIVVSIAADLVLVPWARRTFDNGAIGGPLAYILTEGIILAGAIRPIAPHLICRSVAVRLGKCLVAGGTMLGVAWTLRNQFLLLPIAAGAVVYCTVVLLTRTLTEGERDLIRRLAHRVLPQRA